MATIADAKHTFSRVASMRTDDVEDVGKAIREVAEGLEKLSEALDAKLRRIEQLAAAAAAK